jgi:3-hydroxybutyryl-CoA dehydrogenase
MGAGIAQLGALAGMDTLVHDPVEGAVEHGMRQIRVNLEKGVQRERWSHEDATAASGHLRPAGGLADLAPCDLVIEAAPERLELKRELFQQLSKVCRDDAVLASNTSSILISSLAGAAEHPENVVGMHFFNPPPLMRLLEVIAAEQTGEHAMTVARDAGTAMGKTIVVAQDGPGFLVNRCGRPFGGEALRLLQERVATVEQIDRIVRMGGGYRMGPFELQDLVGIDVGFDVTKSFDAQSFGEPRWKPSMLQARMVAAGRLGRKTERGWYAYEEGKPHRPDDPEPPTPGGGDGRRVEIEGSGPIADFLRERAAEAGFGSEGEVELVVDATVPSPVSDVGLAPEGAPLAALCADRSLSSLGHPEACGFHLLPGAKLVELTRLPTTPDGTTEAAVSFFERCGFVCEWVEDAPGLVLGRIVSQLVNEAAFAVGEGVGSAEDVDTGVTLGLNHPRGPVEWGRLLGFDHVLAAVDGLFDHFHDPRYRAAPLLRSGGIE